MKKDEEVKLIVVTTTYNHGLYIEKCIKSIMEQETDYSYKLLISDDVSTDNTKDIINEYKKKYPDKIDVIFRENNLGAMENFIETLNSVHSEYVALCDGDDYWSDNKKIQKQLDFLESHKDFSLCFSQTLISFEDKSQSDVVHPLNIKEDLTLDDLIKENHIPANTVVYRWRYKEEDSLINEFPKNIVPGDYYLHLMHAKEGKAHFINEIMTFYRRQQSGMWYLSSQADKQDMFYDLYGEPYLNFYVKMEELLNRPNVFKLQKEWIIRCSLLAYINLRKRKKLKKLYKENYLSNSAIFDDNVLVLSRKNKMYYYFVVDKKKLLLKIWNKIRGFHGKK